LIFELFRGYKDCFVWNYHRQHGQHWLYKLTHTTKHMPTHLQPPSHTEGHMWCH